MSDSYELKAEVQTWDVSEDGSGARRFATLTVPFGTARVVFKPEIYNAQSGKGEQRQAIDNHVRGIERDMKNGEFTPTAVSVGFRDRHRKACTFTKKHFSITVAKGDCLPLTDGHQRFTALGRLAEKAEGKHLAKILATPISVTLHIDGDPQRDFINAQKGKPVDAAHMLSLKIQQKLVGEKEYPATKLAFEAAKILGQSPDSPWNKFIRLDTRTHAPISINSLCAKGSSDLSSSLVGLARVGLAAGIKDPKQLAFMVVSAFNAIKTHAPQLLEVGKLLTPPPEGGKGSATLLLGVATCLAYYLHTKKAGLPNDGDLERLATAAAVVFDKAVAGNLSGPLKRQLMKDFAAEFFSGFADLYQGVPLALIQLLSASSFGCSSPPKPAKPAKPPTAPKKPKGKAKKTPRDEEAEGTQSGQVEQGLLSDPQANSEAEATSPDTSGQSVEASDVVPAMLVPDDYSLPKVMVDKFGDEKLRAINKGEALKVVPHIEHHDDGRVTVAKAEMSVVSADEAIPAESFPWDEES